MMNEKAAICGVATTFLALASIAMILRCHVRLRIINAFGWDDSVMLLSMVCIPILRILDVLEHKAYFFLGVLHIILWMHDRGGCLGSWSTYCGLGSKPARDCNESTSLFFHFA